ncbi:brachyurin [Tribolium castaneum]|uniref:Serine protease P123 n=1 Tax=Tribolium castaneum TaxID=7070 RepID=D6WN95_TRICA|nr:PREDICTED: brachyurin [Tribolium castaneum]EFA04565.1 serine protease P123 [Tribolium castaneum]|eukprot:XP_971245.1 PREDICTED: brachyurin [Tribolium castaneum]
MQLHTIAVFLGCVVFSLQTQPHKDGRIIGGNVARAGQFPFAAAITVKTRDSKFFCGGSILTSKHILSAGHCVNGAVEFTVQVGSNHLEGDDNYRYIASTNDYILHPEYDPDTLAHNLGFVVLRMDLRLIVGYLWYVSYLPTTDLVDSEAVTTLGWGQLSDDSVGPVNDLHYVEVVTLSNLECKIIYGDQITEDMVCVEGNYNEGSCIGDSGGPLVQEVRLGLMKQVGIATFVSMNGCESTDPSGFTRIYPHLEWIQNVTNRTY